MTSSPARIVIKPFAFENGQPTQWRAEPEFAYPGMPSFHPRKVHYGVNTTPILAVRDLAMYLPAALKQQLLLLPEDAVYIHPCQLWSSWRCVELNGHKPTNDEWLAERQYWNTFHRDAELKKWAERKGKSVQIMAQIAEAEEKRIEKLKTI